MIKRPAGN